MWKKWVFFQNICHLHACEYWKTYMLQTKKFHIPFLILNPPDIQDGHIIHLLNWTVSLFRN